MRANVARCVLVVLTAVVLSGCYSDGRWSAPNLAFWKSSPFQSTPSATPGPVGTPAKPSGIAAASKSNTTTPSAGVASTGSGATMPSATPSETPSATIRPAPATIRPAPATRRANIRRPRRRPVVSRPPRRRATGRTTRPVRPECPELMHIGHRRRVWRAPMGPMVRPARPPHRPTAARIPMPTQPHRRTARRPPLQHPIAPPPMPLRGLPVAIRRLALRLMPGTRCAHPSPIRAPTGTATLPLAPVRHTGPAADQAMRPMPVRVMEQPIRTFPVRRGPIRWLLPTATLRRLATRRRLSAAATLHRVPCHRRRAAAAIIRRRPPAILP